MEGLYTLYSDQVKCFVCPRLNVKTVRPKNSESKHEKIHEKIHNPKAMFL